MTAPTITSNGGGATATLSLAENIAAVTIVTSTDPDVGATKTFSIVGGLDAALFSIVPATGVLTFIGAPDFETPIGGDNSYEVIVRVTDNTAAIDEQTITVNITNVNEAPVITSNGGGAAATIQVDENTTAVTTVTSTDVDAGATATYSIIGGADAALFTISASTGELTFLSAKNFEIPGDAGANNVYDIIVRVTDGALTDTQTLQVVVNNVNEAPVITSNGGGASANINIVENTLSVTTAVATDVDAGSVLRYSISGADADKFIIHPVTGVLTFIAGHDFEAPDSAINADNIYDVDVTVSDGALTDTQAILVTVTNNAVETTIVGSAVADVINGVVSAPGQPVATANDDKISGNDGDDTITALGGNDKIDGGTGKDAMTGGTGHDLYIVDNVLDTAVELVGEGTDTVLASVTFTLGAHVENLQLTGTSSTNGTGNDLANILVGNTGSNILDGGLGNDLLAGGNGSDTYVVDSASDAIIENNNQGIDTVKASLNWTLGSNIEGLQLTGAANLSGTGNELGNTIIGNTGNNTLVGLDGNDTLNGGTGNDTMLGGIGNDAYVVDSASDVVTELAGQGTIDSVSASVTYTLTAEVEDLLLTGAIAINGTGNVGNNKINGNFAVNTLSGLDGNDTLDGGAGADTMIGGDGDDKIYVDNAGDVVTEGSGALSGTDTVFAFITHTIATNVENLTLTGLSAINGTGNNTHNYLTGNSAVNTLTGNAGADTLDGGGGADILIGGTWGDTYIIDNVGDITTEIAGGGVDTVKSSISTTLQSEVENLTLQSFAVTGTGNGLDNLILGTIGNNTLNGMDGNDTLKGLGGTDVMVGGTGDDTYFVDRVGETVTELAGEGTDTVITSVSLTAAANVENITLGGNASFQAIGNGLNNVLIGNGGNNVISGLDGADTLTGMNGNDTLTGGLGLDTMTGGIGDDTFVFNDVLESGITAPTRDIIAGFNVGDLIKVSAIDANTLVALDQDFVLDTDASFSTGEFSIVVSGSDTIVNFNNDADVAAEMTFIVTGYTALTAADFIL